MNIGERLKRQRLDRGISLEKIATDIKIGARLLEAIEANDFDKLPGGVFRKSFVLQYARAIGVDPESIAIDLKNLSGFDESPPVPGQEIPKFGSDMPALAPQRDWSDLKNSLGALAGVVAVVAACAGVYAWWQNQSQQPHPQPAEAVAHASSPPATIPTPAPVAESNTSAAAEGEASRPATPQPVTQPPVTPPPITPTPGFEAVAANRPQGAVRVMLKAEESTWVQVTADGKRVFFDILPANQTRMFDASQLVKILVGNAGGVMVSLNDKPVGSIGPKGQIRVVEFRPEGFQIVPRTPPTPDRL